MSECKCDECKTQQHDSDCAVHNEPATPRGDCDCKDGWISVEKHPPRCWDYVLLYRDSPCMTPISVGYLVRREDGANVWHFDGTCQHWPEGTFPHWQPLPPPPTK